MGRMTARYAGTCRDCGGGFPAGTLIDFTKLAPKGRKTAHADCENPGAAVTVEIEAAYGHGPGCFGECDGLFDCSAPGGNFYADAASAGRGVSYEVRTSGGTFYRNRNGRCEDAPCCGCCTI